MIGNLALLVGLAVLAVFTGDAVWRTRPEPPPAVASLCARRRPSVRLVRIDDGEAVAG